MGPFSSIFRLSLLWDQNVYVTQSSLVFVLLIAAFSDVTSPLYNVEKGGSNLTCFFQEDRGQPEAVSAPARTTDMELLWQAASRISSLSTSCDDHCRVCVSVCRKMESSSWRGCWTSTGVCADQSDFRCTTTMKDFVSTGMTSRSRPIASKYNYQ